MAILLPIEGSLAILTYLYDNILTAKDWYGYLYVNNHTPALTDTNSDYTAASDIMGVAMDTVYTTPTVDTGVGGKMEAGDILFEQTADTSQTVYGWFVRDSDSKVVFAEKFATPIPLAYTGDKVKVYNHVFKDHN